MTKQEILKTIFEEKVVAVVRVEEPEKLKKVIQAIYNGGVKIIEITMTVPNAISMIEKMSAEFGNKVLIGVGSVTDKQTAADAISAGANYVVSPVTKKEVVETVLKLDKPVMPGAFTPTEALNAFEMGADIVKIFPADVLGMNFFKGVLAPMPQLKLMPTGGVSLTNAGEWLKAGACAVGVGTALLDKAAIKNENYDLLTANAKTIIETIKTYEANK
ncbi:MAG: bifunctional 4-hydroxy-2-oxoglutarate aldolase/2-dehydro-3-deoxy-phosphogluconate aldolase [Bacteroidetes bacterium]|nr:bifunctional 4-hydroxy-2-oxoglutarate aldolase/2-dehydro-3-deoxy-phosphogluconate aldolase [Bacteroidota bacterium]